MCFWCANVYNLTSDKEVFWLIGGADTFFPFCYLAKKKKKTLRICFHLTRLQRMDCHRICWSVDNALKKYVIISQWRCQICWGVKKKKLQCFLWTGFELLALVIKSSKSSIINLQTNLRGIQRRRIFFFNQTSKRLIFIEQAFGVETTIGFQCWFRVLLLSCLVFYF